MKRSYKMKPLWWYLECIFMVHMFLVFPNSDNVNTKGNSNTDIPATGNNSLYFSLLWEQLADNRRDSISFVWFDQHAALGLLRHWILSISSTKFGFIGSVQKFCALLSSQHLIGGYRRLLTVVTMFCAACWNVVVNIDVKTAEITLSCGRRPAQLRFSLMRKLIHLSFLWVSLFVNKMPVSLYLVWGWSSQKCHYPTVTVIPLLCTWMHVIHGWSFEQWTLISGIN